MASVALSGIRKDFGSATILHELDLKVEAGEFLVLVGPSGCGKSTLLRLIAGLEEPTAGSVSIDGRNMDHVSPKDRGVAMVFQSYALYPHMSVAENMAFSLKLAGVARTEIDSRVAEAAKVLSLETQLAKKPSQLSGGQKQRVAMGRAMVRRPKVFLFDEPLSNLDAQLRVKMRAEISALHRRSKSTVVYVTHDQVEAMTLADRIAVMRGGRIEQIGPPLEVYRDPKTRFVASFIGSPSMNFLPEGQGEVGFRPEAAKLAGGGNLRSMASGTVSLIEPLGAVAYVHVQSEGGVVAAQTRTDQTPELDSKASVFADPNDLFHFDSSGARLPA